MGRVQDDLYSPGIYITVLSTLKQYQSSWYTIDELLHIIRKGREIKDFEVPALRGRICRTVKKLEHLGKVQSEERRKKDRNIIIKRYKINA